jgi:Domain of unknown function (DUF1996)
MTTMFAGNKNQTMPREVAAITQVFRAFAASLLSCAAVTASAQHGGHSHLPYINPALIPPPTTTFITVDRVRATNELATPRDAGAFRVSCKYSHTNFDDPIVFPNQPGMAHLHTFFGNTATNANSTAASLLSTGHTTCTGGTINKSAYWVPTLINTATGAPLVPTDAIFYYKTDGIPPRFTQAMPNGLRMIAGNASATSPGPEETRPYHFACLTADGTNEYGRSPSIPDCLSGESIWVNLSFPRCWDGRNLDSADHKSHMSFPNGWHLTENPCPATHPIALPHITFNMAWRLPPGVRGSQIRLSSDNYTTATGPGGYSMHGDWYMGWKPEIRDMWVVGCLRESKDCHANLLKDNFEYY